MPQGFSPRLRVFGNRRRTRIAHGTSTPSRAILRASSVR
jgi:hypothetical protein